MTAVIAAAIHSAVEVNAMKYNDKRFFRLKGGVPETRKTPFETEARCRIRGKLGRAKPSIEDRGARADMAGHLAR